MDVPAVSQQGLVAMCRGLTPEVLARRFLSKSPFQKPFPENCQNNQTKGHVLLIIKERGLAERNDE